MIKYTPGKNSAAGFSMVEMSIVITVLGLLVAALLSSSAVKRDTEDVEITKNKLDAIEEALQIHFNSRGDLPCPADSDVAPNTAGFGVATDCTAAATAGMTDITPTGGAASDEIRIGVLPTRTLSLPDSYMFDEWGNRFTYAVIKDLAKDQTIYDAFATALTTGVILINDNTGAQIVPAVTNSVVAYIVLSHGGDEKGAWSKNGIQRTCGTTELDRENCDGDAVFISDEVDDTTPGATYFFDYVRYKLTTDLQ